MVTRDRGGLRSPGAVPVTAPMVVERPEAKPSLARRLGALVAVGIARVLATQSPARICRVLTEVGAGARPADYDTALAARQAVTAVSLTCRGARGCVPRSIATALLCRLTGTFPTWRVGVRTIAPFAAHAWVEADGVIVGESMPAGYLRPLLSVGPGTGTGPRRAGGLRGSGGLRGRGVPRDEGVRR